MKIAILAFGREGQAAYQYWNKPENQITVCDSDESVTVPDGADANLGPGYLEDLSGFDLIIRSPYIQPSLLVAANDPAILDKVTTVTNEFMQVSPSKNIIGVTGTKGKGTTSTLITRMLQASGKRVHLGGNIGVPPLSLLHGAGALQEGATNIEPDDWIVLELSSYQLIDLKQSPPIAVILMVEPEHLDWHGAMEDYITAKRQLFRWQTPQDIAVFFAENEHSMRIAGISAGIKIPYYAPPGAYVDGDEIIIHGTTICKTNEIQLLGKHNWQNVCAAVTAAWEIVQDITSIRSVITEFTGLPHRLETVRELDGVTYINDSFASAPGAAIAALDAVKQAKVMIIGGYDRHLDLTELAAAIKAAEASLRKVILIGASAGRTAEAFRHAGFDNFVEINSPIISPIIEEARGIAQPGDAVVLSPGFPSFDMFKNFEERGTMFKEAVKNLS